MKAVGDPELNALHQVMRAAFAAVVNRRRVTGTALMLRDFVYPHGPRHGRASRLKLGAWWLASDLTPGSLGARLRQCPCGKFVLTFERAPARFCSDACRVRETRARWAVAQQRRRDEMKAHRKVVNG